jgi:hypothetical protein
MTKQPKDTSKPADQPDKKKSETVHLTAEDLRAISGGAGRGSAGVQPADKVIIVTKKP